jgi:phenylpropionate dioxygenase-like ring-hydroxylating dioxygenase large terminal subunit
MNTLLSSRSAVPRPRACTFAENDWPVLSRYWYPVAIAENVTDRPVGVTLLDEKIVLYRVADRVVAARDLCIHRGTPLSVGRIEKDELVCAYHGYRYDVCGRCTRVPAHPSLPIPAKLALTLYPCREAYGLLWVSLDETTSEKIPEFPEFGRPGYQIITLQPPTWNAAAGRQVESFCDVAHFAWLHTATFARAEDFVVPNYDVTPTETGVHVDYKELVTHPHAPVGDSSWPKVKRTRLYDIDLPFTARLTVEHSDGRREIYWDSASPASARKSIIFNLIGRNFDHDKPPQDVANRQHAVLEEDRFIVERQCPEDLPIDLQEEVHVRADKTSIAYRQQLRLIGLGSDYTS